jgi:predicted nucleic acid-binding protein
VVCVDASLAIKWILPEDLSDPAHKLRATWRRREITMIAPPLFSAEVTSVVRERTFRGDITEEEAQTMLQRSLDWEVRLSRSSQELQRRALAIANRSNHPKAYDAQYLALADLAECELWTGDRRLVNSLEDRLPWVKWVGDFAASS